MTAQISIQNMFSALSSTPTDEVDVVAETTQTTPVPTIQILKRQEAKGSLALATLVASAVAQAPEEEDEESMIIDLGDNEFPALGSTSPKAPPAKQAKPVKLSAKPVEVKFTVASSRISELRGGQKTVESPGFRKFLSQEATEHAKELAKDLTCTKPCQYVVRKEDGKFGVCYREHCTFAHSHSELRLPKCAFGDRCKKRDGAYNPKTRKLDKTSKCQFMHPDETVDGFYGRIKRVKPDLPETSETTRKPCKPRQSKKAMQAEQEEEIARITKAMEKDEASEASETIAPASTPQPTAETVIRVPREMALEAMKAALESGLTNFRVVYID